jgi:hypothetical protein
MHAVSADGKTALDLTVLHNDADGRKNLLILADAGVFKGQAPPAHLLPQLGLALSERAEEAKA